MTFISLCVSLLVCSFLQDPAPLAKHLWKHRVVIIYSPVLDERHQHQLAGLAGAEQGVADRDLVVFSLFNESGYGPKKEALEIQDHRLLKKEYTTQGDEFRFLLIGKDGSVKLDRTEIIAPAELFAVIDKMPMRLDEMKKKQ